MNVFELFASLTLDKKDYDKGLDDAETKANKVGPAIGSVLGSGVKALGSALATAGKISAAAIGAGATAVGALAKQSVDAYGEYEQLVGGVKKLFGNMGLSIEEYAQQQGKSVDEVRDEWIKLGTAQNEVLQNAKNAFQTVGMDTNTYLQNATSFSAALIKSLGGDTVKAASQVDLAMQSIADNVNTFGTDMDSVTNAFMGFSKQNYTMLDNLKLGYGGTKEGMKQLIADANEYAKSIGQASNLSIDSFSDIVTAIDLIQQKQNIAGTTAREASTTLQGSFSALKAAWANLVAGFSDKGSNIGELIKNVVSTAETYFNNLMPVVEQALGGVAKAISKMTPVIVEKIPALVEEIMPSILEGASGIVNALVDVLPQLLQLLADQLPQLAQTIIPAAISMLTTVIIALATALPDLIQIIVDMIPQIVTQIKTAFSQNSESLKEAGGKLLDMLVKGLVEGLPSLLTNGLMLIMRFIEMLTNPSTLSGILDTGLKMLMALVDGLISALPSLIESAIVIIENLLQVLVDNIPVLMETGAQLLYNFLLGLMSVLPHILEFASQLLFSIVSTIIKSLANVFMAGVKIGRAIGEGFSEFIDMAKSWGKDLIDNFINGIMEKWEALKQTVANVAQTVKDFLGFSEPKEGPLSNFHTYAPDMMQLYADGIKDNAHLVTDQLKNVGLQMQTVADGFSISMGSTETAAAGGINYTQIINAPTELSPSEIARQTRNANRNMMLALRGV